MKGDRNDLYLEKYNHVKQGDIFKHNSSFWILLQRTIFKDGEVAFCVKHLGLNHKVARLKAFYYRIKYKNYLICLKS